MKKNKTKKFQFKGADGKFIWLSKRQIINRVKKNEFLHPTKRNELDITAYYEVYSDNIEPVDFVTEKKKGKRKEKDLSIKATLTEALKDVEEKEKKIKKEITKRGKKRELIREPLDNIPCSSVPAKFADSDAWANDLIAEGKIKRYPDCEFKLVRLNGQTYETKNRIDFINEYNSEVSKLYDVVDLILDSKDKHKVSSPQFFTHGYFFLQYNFVIVGGFVDFKKTEIKGCPMDLFNAYYLLYVQDYE